MGSMYESLTVLYALIISFSCSLDWSTRIRLRERTLVGWLAYIDSASWEECHASLRVARLVFGQELKLVVLVLEISDIAVSVWRVSAQFSLNHFSLHQRDLEGLAAAVLTPCRLGIDSMIHHLVPQAMLAKYIGGVSYAARGAEPRHTPERHAHARDRVERREASDGLVPARLPKSNLPLAHTRESRGSKAVMLAHPDCATVFGSRMARGLVHRLLLPHIEHAQLLVPRRCHQEGSIGAPRYPGVSGRSMLGRL